MSQAVKSVEEAMREAAANRPSIEGFPHLAETLRRSGVSRNVWFLPAMESIYLTDLGPVVSQGDPLIQGMASVRDFDEAAVVRALEADRAGRSTFPAFVSAIWDAGVVRYEVDLERRTCTYFGWDDSRYVESYPAVEPTVVSS